MTNPFFAELLPALGLPPGTEINVTGVGDMPSAYAVTDLAAASIGAAGAAVAAYIDPAAPESVNVDRRLASFWFQTTVHPRGWSLPETWDSVAGDYAARDAWIRLHTNADAHRKAALSVLGVAADRDAVTKAVALWSAQDLEDAVVSAGGCAAAMRAPEDWAVHPNGAAVASEPLVHVDTQPGNAPSASPLDPRRPLQGIRVLDLTRVLAGPVAGRFLAGYGAEVLRIDPPWWDEPGVLPEVTLGKRRAGLDLRTAEDRDTLKGLMAQCDVFLHGYRADALEKLGFGAGDRRMINPGMIDVCLNAYGWTGPWRDRRGFDSLVQMSSGIAEYGMRRFKVGTPTPLPAQALDHATGYFMAAAVVRGLTLRRMTGDTTTARLSLSRTARLLVDHISEDENTSIAPVTSKDLMIAVEATGWGAASRTRFPLEIPGCPVAWDYPAGPLRTSPPTFMEPA